MRLSPILAISAAICSWAVAQRPQPPRVVDPRVSLDPSGIVEGVVRGSSAESFDRAVACRGGAEGMEVFGERVIVKLAEGSGADLVDGELRSHAGADLSAVRPWFDAVDAERLVPNIDWHELGRWQARAAANLGPDAKVPGHMGLWFRLRCADAREGAAMVARLLREPLVEFVYQEPVAHEQCTGALTEVAGATPQNPNDPPPPTPDFTPRQTYMGPGPFGLGSLALQGVVGGRGRNVAVGQVETDFVLGHEDIIEMNAANMIGPQPLTTTAPANHGTAGASLITGDRNGFGVTGLADLSDMRFIVWSTNGVASSMLDMAAALPQGSPILVILSYRLAQTSFNDFVPVEYIQADFNAIQTITANGYHLLENAGNGGANLDDPRYLRRFDRSFRDSGAVMVGAVDDAVPFVRSSFSNYGTRVDCCAQGLNAMTAGYGTWFSAPGTRTQSYTERYQGTSSATGMLMGGVAQLIGAARMQLGRDLGSRELRDLLSQNGEPASRLVGLRPNLTEIAELTGMIDGLRISVPEAAPGQSFDLVMEGPSGTFCLLYIGFGLSPQPSGFNRDWHLDLAGLDTQGSFVLTGGTATETVQVPAALPLQGIDAFFQGVQVRPLGAVHVTNSVQVFVP